ncbi:MAG: hypothetical protein O2816_01890 [Planctomycetota bacterium]|nr:hypothetical protein [Planctomycetota bacterium]
MNAASFPYPVGDATFEGYLADGSEGTSAPEQRAISTAAHLATTLLPIEVEGQRDVPEPGEVARLRAGAPTRSSGALNPGLRLVHRQILALTNDTVELPGYGGDPFPNRIRLTSTWPATGTGGLGSVLGASAAGDLDGDGRLDFYPRRRAGEKEELLALSLASSDPLFRHRDEAKWRPGWGPGYGCCTLSTGKHPVIVLSDPIQFLEVSVRCHPPAGGTNWTARWGDVGASSGVALAPWRDEDGDGVDDFLAGTSDWFWHGNVCAGANLRCLSGAHGTLLWILDEEQVGQDR